MAMLWVDGTEIKTPSSFEWGLNDVSDSQAGRTQDALMHKNRIAQKRKIALGWNFPTPKEASTILKAFNPEYIVVKYWDSMDGQYESRTFYVGDRSNPMKYWWVGNQRFEKLSFDIIER